MAMADRAEGMWEALVKGLQDGAAVAVAKAEELTQQSKARLDIAATKARLSRLLAGLGVVAYKKLDDGDAAALAASDEARSLCEQIRDAEEELAAQIAALRDLTSSSAEGETAAAEASANAEE